MHMCADKGLVAVNPECSLRLCEQHVTTTMQHLLETRENDDAVNHDEHTVHTMDPSQWNDRQSILAHARVSDPGRFDPTSDGP
eukprot:1454602-Rhodomonas_salina.2